MSRVCEKCGKKPVAGRTYARRGLAKKKGGVGRKVTGKTKRRFVPNIQSVRVRETNGTVHRIRICARCLRTALRDGTIIKAVRKTRAPKKKPAPPPAPDLDVREDLGEDGVSPDVEGAAASDYSAPAQDAPAASDEEAASGE